MSQNFNYKIIILYFALLIVANHDKPFPFPIHHVNGIFVHLDLDGKTH